MNLFALRFDNPHHRVVRKPVLENTEYAPGAGDLVIVRWDAGVVIVRPQFDRSQSVAKWFQQGQQLAQLLDDPELRLLKIDLSNIGWIRSELVSQLTKLHCCASRLGKEVVLINVSESVSEIFHLTRVDRLLQFSTVG